jgi:Peptidase inhibitor family I36
MRSSRSIAVVIGTLLAAWTVLSATSAAADPAPGAPAQPDDPASVSAPPGAVTALDTTCAAGDLCFWVDTNRGGAKGRLSGSNPAWKIFSQPQCRDGHWGDCASSIANNGTRCTARVWEHDNYRGAWLDIQRGDSFNLTDKWIVWQVVSWNDQISSNNWHSCINP